MTDFQDLLDRPIQDDAEAPAPEYRPEFTALFTLAQGKPEQRMGEAVIAAVPPPWRDVEQGAAALLVTARDLRVAVLLAQARLRNGGLTGFFEALAFVRALLERHWETLHPALEDGDAIMRVSALAGLVDPDVVLAPFREAEVASARGVGRACVRELEPGADDPEAAKRAEAVGAVLAGCAPEELARVAAAAKAALADLRAIEEQVRERTQGSAAVDLSRLSTLVQLVVRTLAPRVAQAGPAEAEGSAAGPAEAAASPQAARGDGAIRSREDVVAALDRICAYYERFEPSSPVPLLLRRSRRLVHKGFFDIVRDLVPDAVGQVEALQGKAEE